MKTALDHLPSHKREQIGAIARLIQDSAPVDMIILFGSYARGDWVEDLPNAYFSDFDLMVVVATPELAQDERHWNEVSERARLIGGRIPVSIVVHDIKELNQEIRTGQYFFADVVNEGVLLHDSRRYHLAQPKAHTPAERLQLARRNFTYWFGSANEFWRGAIYYGARGLGPHAAFCLHQATERYFHAVLLVFTGYKPKTHDIQALAKQTAPFHPELEGALPRVEPEDQRLFSLLKRAYIEARYSKSYRITDAELVAVRAHVLDLGRRARQASLEKLATIDPGSEVGSVPDLPTLEDSAEVPELTALDDPQAVQAWRDAMVRLSYERGDQLRREGEAQGRQTGMRIGEALGRARAIVDVLRRRGVELSDADVERVLGCRNDAMLDQWWDRAWTARTVDEIWSE